MTAGRFPWVSILLSLLVVCTSAWAQGIVDSKHNLTRSGPGTVKARPEIQSDLCIFCHTPHQTRRRPQLGQFGWNRSLRLRDTHHPIIQSR